MFLLCLCAWVPVCVPRCVCTRLCVPGCVCVYTAVCTQVCVYLVCVCARCMCVPGHVEGHLTEHMSAHARVHTCVRVLGNAARTACVCARVCTCVGECRTDGRQCLLLQPNVSRAVSRLPAVSNPCVKRSFAGVAHPVCRGTPGSPCRVGVNTDTALAGPAGVYWSLKRRCNTPLRHLDTYVSHICIKPETTPACGPQWGMGGTLNISSNKKFIPKICMDWCPKSLSHLEKNRSVRRLPQHPCPAAAIRLVSIKPARVRGCPLRPTVS